MQIQLLKESILNKDIPNLLIFIGEEKKLIDIYVNQIEKELNTKATSVNDVVRAINLQTQKSLFTKPVDLMVVKNDKDVISNKSIWNLIKNIKNHLILIYDDLKKDSFYKEFEPYIVEFKKMTVQNIKASLIKHLSDNNMKLPEKYIDWLINNCSNDYGRCLNELDKILIFKDDHRTCEELFKQFAKDGVFHYDIPDCIFDFSNAFILRNIDKVYEIYEDLKQTSDGPTMIFSVLYNNFRDILTIQSAKELNAEKLGIDQKKLYVLRSKINHYKNDELSNILLLISKFDRDIKMGTINDYVALEYFMSKVL